MFFQRLNHLHESILIYSKAFWHFINYLRQIPTTAIFRNLGTIPVPDKLGLLTAVGVALMSLSLELDLEISLSLSRPLETGTGTLPLPLALLTLEDDSEATCWTCAGFRRLSPNSSSSEKSGSIRCLCGGGG